MRVSLLVAALLTTISVTSVADDYAAWETAYDKDGRRYIPVALWNGGAWDGSRIITLPKVDLTFGRRDNKRIFGPRAWTHEASGTKYRIYERHNRSKVQYFTVNRKKDGLGRVYDNRYSRYCPDEVKFPIGWWKQGEKRIYDIDCEGRQRHIEVTITKLNFTYDGVPHSLEFHWKLGDGSKRGGNNIYTYSPGLGLVDVTQN
ncbi:MAG: hypothetical protein CMM52_00080 [Rhodospirillaceae bacterium]|nr:hypothetical protein [Rhodospirillaceae bacterium]|tara:strand:+ start:12538 stop:13143 length:606 start_codon:yes stop_codon:yes gene_type:complete